MKLLLIYCWCFLFFFACGKDSGEEKQNSDMTSDLVEKGEIAVSGIVKKLSNGDAFEGADICVVGSGSCVKTAKDGRFKISKLKSNEKYSITIKAEGYVDGIASFFTDSETLELPPLSMGSKLLINIQNSSLGVDPEEGTGQVAFSISNGINGDGINVPGIVVELSPKSGQGPFYLNKTGLPDPKLEKTSEKGGGLLVNLKPGKYFLKHIGLSAACTRLLGWGSPDNVEFEVLADHATYVRTECK